MIREKIISDLSKTLEKLNFFSENLVITKPSLEKFGDYTTNVAFEISQKTNKQSPLDVAKKIEANFIKNDYLEKINVEQRGFINFYLKREFLQSQILEIISKKENYGISKIASGKKARVEFISGNPTGPLHIGNARGGPLGDSLARVLELVGYAVLREYIHNDVGGQVEKFGQSLFSKINKLEENSEYQGPYMKELAEKIGAVKTPTKAAQKGTELILAEILKTSADLGIKFDQIYKESDFFKSGKTKESITQLSKKGVVKEKDSAIWFAPNDEFLKDKKSVLVKSDGNYTYFANDIAYHQEKFNSNYDLIIDIFGSNHHGHIPRIKAAMATLGYDLSKLKFILYQFVRVKRGKKAVKMSKRAGDFVTASEVLEEVGKDAFRFFMLMNEPNTHIDFDLKTAKEKSEKNPVYYVQYAHARIKSVLEAAKKEFGDNLPKLDDSKVNLLNNQTEISLIKKLITFPELVEDISKNFQIHTLCYYSLNIAKDWHKFYEQHRIISSDKNLSTARLQLASAVATILSSSLNLLGVNAPSKM